MDDILVIGGGSWATALVKLLSNNCKKVYWWMRDEEQVQQILSNQHNPKYLSSVTINLEFVHPSTKLVDLLGKCNTLVIATPSAFVAEIFKNINLEGKTIVSAIKGIIPQTNQVPATYFKDIKGIVPNRFAIISGPCHAEEVAQERLSFLTIASSNNELANDIMQVLSCSYIKCSFSSDVIGIEISAILKNVYALFAGICHGVGYGDNFMAVLMSNAIREVNSFTFLVDNSDRDVMESAYLGDLLVTSYSPHSRNRAFGNLLGKGYSITEVQHEMNMIAEGYYAVAGIHKLNENIGAQMPIAEAVYKILYCEANLKEELEIVVRSMK